MGVCDLWPVAEPSQNRRKLNVFPFQCLPLSMSSSLNVLPCQVFPIQTSISPPLKIILFQCPLSMFSALNIFSLNILSSHSLPGPPHLKRQYFSLLISFSQYSPFSIFFPLDVLNSQCILLLMFYFLNVFLLNISSLLKPQYLFSSFLPLSMSYVLPFQFLPSQYLFLKVPPPPCPFSSTSSLLNFFPLNIIFFKWSLVPRGFWTLTIFHSTYHHPLQPHHPPPSAFGA